MEATEGASVEDAYVTTVGPAKTAGAPWKLFRVWQTTRWCVAVEGFASVEHVNVTRHIPGRPVRTALLVLVCVRYTGTVWSAGHLGQEEQKNGERGSL